MLTSHHHLRIKNDVHTEDEGAQASIDNIDDFVAREEKDKETEKHQAQYGHKEYSSASREIDLGLHSENGQAQDQDDGDA